ncbi:hypothetical protein AB4343_16215 [Vibrio breoganii]|uniref:Uncharacterized protein n=1 Tax=Vibrio breoganii TaxID=553239 RepID=A0AAP8SY70_9VIBR|nr:hypothetical protein [Vibrio breoganii]PMP09031.1 hypothetical protein BCS94_06310 [Vibrio breoganii]PMP14527.1 hypothetical protein BCS93_04085 [Vibrio breoganii]
MLNNYVVEEIADELNSAMDDECDFILDAQTVQNIAIRFGVLRKTDHKLWFNLLNENRSFSCKAAIITNLGKNFLQALSLIKAEATTLSDRKGLEDILTARAEFLSHVSATVEVNSSQLSFLDQKIDLLVGLLFIERKFSWITPVLFSGGWTVALQPKERLVPQELGSMDEVYGFGNKTHTYLCKQQFKKSAELIRKSLVSYGLYMHLSVDKYDSLELMTDLASEQFAKFVVAEFLKLDPADISTPFRGVVENYVSHFDRLLFDSMIDSIIHDKVGNWFSNLTASELFDKLDESLEILVQPSQVETRGAVEPLLKNGLEEKLRELKSELAKYDLEHVVLTDREQSQLLVRLVNNPNFSLYVSGEGLEKQLHVLKRSIDLFTYKSNYTGDMEQVEETKETLNFLWASRKQLYCLPHDDRGRLKIARKDRYQFSGISSLLKAQLSGKSAIARAKLAIEIRYRLGFVVQKEKLNSALLQPNILDQFLRERALSIELCKVASNDITDKKEAKPTASMAHDIHFKEFKWPSTVANVADGSLPEINWPKIGMLKAVGYSVGKDGLAIGARLEILKNVYMETLPFIESKAYVSEWGLPQSASRLKKMAETIANLTKGAKRKSTDMQLAIRDWEHDLAWLKQEYYLKHKYTWVWPNSGETKQNKPVELAPVKSYKSSRDFLVEQYTNKAGELCCQICQSALPFKLPNNEYFWEETPVLESVEPSPFSDLVLCPNHRAMYLHANLKSNQLLRNIGEKFSKDVVVRLASEDVSIFVSELHQKKLRGIAETLNSSSESDNAGFDFSQVDKGLQGVTKIYLYENEGKWLVSSRAKVMYKANSKEEGQRWIYSFDLYRNMRSTTTEKMPKPKAKKAKASIGNRKMSSIAAIRFGSTKKATTQSSYKNGYLICTTCSGDGGINGGCWKCGGTGWM